MKSPRNVVIILILSCSLYLLFGVVKPASVFASGCAWYGGADGTANTGAASGQNPKNPGNCDTLTGDPVDVATGRCTYTLTDLFVSSPGILVSLTRTYNNLDLKSSSLGWGWRFSLDMRVIFVSNTSADITNAVIINSNGKRDIYTKGTGNTFDPPSGIYNMLTLNADGTSTLNTRENLTYTFNQGGRLKEIKDLNSNMLTINYTDNTFPTAEITTIVDSVGRTYTFTYENGKIKTITDPALRTITYTYNGDLLTHVTNPVNETIEYGYDPTTYNLLTIKNPEGVIYLTNTYDAQGRITTQNHAGKLYEFTYWDGITEVKEQGLYTYTYYYNTTYGFVTQDRDPYAKWTTYEWDIATKQLMSVTDPLGNVTSYTYYPNGKIWTITRTISSAESKTTTYEYYDQQYFSKLKSITDPEGNVTTFTYTTDGKANLYSIEDYIGNITYFEDYNIRGQFGRIKDANGKYTYITYDQYGYLESIKDPLNRITYFTHDIVGNRTQIKDALNRTTDYTYQNFTRLDYTTDALNHITDFDYDLNGNLKTVTDARGHDTHFEYNEINQIRYVKDHFLNVKAEYIYDNNNLWKVKNARNEMIEYSYDALNRVQTKTLNGVYGADTATYTYDDAGRLTNINNTAADLTLGYDKAHRVISVSTSGAMPPTTISYGYYLNDIRKTITDTAGVTNYSLRTKLNPIETITTPNAGAFTISYDNLNRRNTMTMGNGIIVTYTYDNASQLGSIVFKDGAIIVTSNEYTLYDDVGNRKTEIDLSGTHNYNYDAIYRLTSATHPSGNPNEFYNYVDPVGSVGNRTSSHLSTSYTTNELNRLIEDDNYLYGYDADGNMTSKQNKTTNETTYFYYDAENKLVQLLTPNSQLITYSYDGFGRRVKKNVNGVVMFYVYDNEDIRFETDAVGTITAEYVHGMGIDEPLAMRRNGTNYYYHVNGLGSVIALTNSSKAVVQSYVYDSFGQIISQTGSITNPYTFTGREYDSEIGSYYYRARYYDARMGRFISEDPIGLAGGDVNLYVMVGNNPVNFVDPWGLYWQYSQSTGQLTYVNNQTGAQTPVGTGYSGHGAGLNNPNMQNVPYVGPIPQGTYNIGNAYNHANLGPVTMNLDPSAGTNTFGRNAFRIHGDNPCGCQSASHGCIIFPRNLRNQISGSGDRELRIVP